MQSDRRHLLEQFTLTHLARKVVGVGSVGTRAWILLMDAGDDIEPLFLQAKEAQPSVLEPSRRKSKYANQGERVVAGQHLMQAVSDIFLGWQRTTGPRRRSTATTTCASSATGRSPAARGDAAGRDEALRGTVRMDARPGPRPLRRPRRIAAYLGGSDAFDRAVADFAESYADQNERDYDALKAAVASGRAEAVDGL